MGLINISHVTAHGASNSRANESLPSSSVFVSISSFTVKVCIKLCLQFILVVVTLNSPASPFTSGGEPKFRRTHHASYN